jgi:predicted SAM-dependent methyltransferase
MTFVINALKKLVPTCLGEPLALFVQQRDQIRRKRAIAERNEQFLSALLASALPINLELGAGENRGIAGWTYADLNEKCDLNLDLTQPLPFPDNCISTLYSSHLLEHFKYDDLVKLLSECFRVLKTGGVFSAAVPNARIYLEAYYRPESFDPGLYCRHIPAFNYNSKIDYVNYIAYMDGHHNYMFDEENLLVILEKTGFKNVRLREFDQTLDMEVRNFQTIYVLAEK